MIGTRLIEELVQSVALSHRVKGFDRASLLLLAAPESGKTTIAKAATAGHVQSIAIISGRSVLAEVDKNPKLEFLLFNDLSAVRALSPTATALLIVLLNQFVQDERGIVAFAGQPSETIKRPIGVIGCLPFRIFADHRSKWREMGFVSRMIPFAYEYPDDLIAEIKDLIDKGVRTNSPGRAMPRAGKKQIAVSVSATIVRKVRHLSDARANKLGDLGLRLLKNYHVLIRAHAILLGRDHVNADDLTFLRTVDEYVSIRECKPLERHD